MKIDKVEQTNTINYNIKVIHESWVKYMYLKYHRLNPYGTPYYDSSPNVRRDMIIIILK